MLLCLLKLGTDDRERDISIIKLAKRQAREFLRDRGGLNVKDVRRKRRTTKKRPRPEGVDLGDHF